MSLHIKSAALGPLMIDLEGKDLAVTERELLLHPLVGGIILFARNYESPQQLKKLLNAIRAVRPELLIAGDQEGGRVQRFRDGFSRLPPPAEFGAHYQNGPSQAQQMAQNSATCMARELLAAGLDFSFAPVLDIDHKKNVMIGDRSFSGNPQSVTELALAYIEGMQKAGMRATGKHFPGHGAVVADSHKELPVDDRAFADIWQFDLLPYRQLHSKLGGIMAAHIIYSTVDANPASFSTVWLQDILRGQIGFQGAVFSDDLNMGGADFGGDAVSRTQAALAAGCDMVLLCNNRSGVVEPYWTIANTACQTFRRRGLHAMRSYQTDN